MAYMIIIGMVLWAIRQFTDFIYQTDQHEWWTVTQEPTKRSWWYRWIPLRMDKVDGVYECVEWRLRIPRGKKWGFWDFIPHDPWHINQWVRNTSGWVGSFFVLHPLSHAGWIELGILAGVYAFTRGFFFSLPKAIITAVVYDDSGDEVEEKES